jgi:o-succinylbenzoate synthase
VADRHVRVDRLSLHPYAVPLVRPWLSARGATFAREGWLVCVEDVDGARGWGECAPLPGAGSEAAADAWGALSGAVARLPGLTAEEALEALPSARTPAARFGVEGALMDLCARRAGLPLFRYLRAGASGHVEVNAFGGAVDEGLAARMARAAAAGFGVVKLKLATRDAEEELATLEGLAGIVAVPARWRLDVNRGWDMRTARAAWPRLAALPVEGLEEPASDADAAGLEELQAAAPFAVALDESLGQWPPERPLPVRRQVLKPMVVGGAGAALALARRPGVESVITSSVDTATGLWHAAHVAAALDNGLAHGLDTGDWLEDVLGPALPIRQGRIRLGEEPGLGWMPEAPGD